MSNVWFAGRPNELRNLPSLKSPAAETSNCNVRPANRLAALVAARAGMLDALWLRHAGPDCRCCRNFLHPDRRLPWPGLLLIASVYFFPAGVVGWLRNPSRKPS